MTIAEAANCTLSPTGMHDAQEFVVAALDMGATVGPAGEAVDDHVIIHEYTLDVA